MAFIINRSLGLALYLIILVYYTIALKFANNIGKDENTHEDETFEYFRVMGQFTHAFFTGWNFTIQVIFVLIAIGDELAFRFNLPLGVQKPLSSIRSYLFSTLVLPVGLMVVTIFWVIFLIDRKLIFPEEIDAFFPPWLNHTMHTFIAVPIALELCMPKQYNFIPFQRAFVGLTIYLAIYQALYFAIYLQHGVWLYLIYESLTWVQRLVFTLMQYSIGVVFLKVGIDIQNSKQKRKVK